MLRACALTVWRRQDRWTLSADLDRPPGSLASGRDMSPRDPRCLEGLSRGLVRQKSQRSRICAYFLGTDFIKILKGPHLTKHARHGLYAQANHRNGTADIFIAPFSEGGACLGSPEPQPSFPSLTVSPHASPLSARICSNHKNLSKLRLEHS